MIAPPRRTRLGTYTALIAVTAISLGPVLWVWISSFRTSQAIATDPLGLPWPLDPSSFVTAWQEARFSSYLMNSVIVSGCTVALSLIVAIPAAYALTILRPRGHNLVFTLFLLGLMIPIWSIIIPLFFQLGDLGLIDTRTGAILVETVLGLPFALFILRAALRTFPRDLLEAARIDGAGDLRIMRSVAIPILMPTIQAVVVFEFMWSWNDLVVPLFFLQSDAVRTLPIGLTFFQGRFTTDTAVLFAGTTLASLPVVVLYLLFNRRFVQGLTSGAVK